MKKTLKITGIVIGSLIVLMLLAAILIPILFKDQLVEKAKTVLNENINAKVDFKDVDISIFKNFPNITLSLNNLTVIGVDEFKTDTLASVSSVSISINIMSYLKKGEIDINSIKMVKPHVHAIMLESGMVNWDIAKPDTTKTITTTETTGFETSMNLNKVEFLDGAILYEDMQTKTLVGLKSINLKLSGNMSKENTTLDLQLSTDQVNVLYNGIPYLLDLSFGINTKVEADLKNIAFTLKDNETTIGPLAFKVNGTVKLGGTEQEGINIDLNYNAKVETLADLLKLIPESIIPEAKNVKTTGTMVFKGWIKGIYNETLMPQFWTELSINNGSIKYTHLPESVNNFNVELKTLFDSNNDTNTLIDISRFHFEIAGNPFDLKANITTPLTDAAIKATAKGKIDFKSLTNALPLNDLNISGILSADVNFSAHMSAIEKEQYDKLNVSGHVNLKSFLVKSKDIPTEIQINTADFVFTPRYVELKAFDGKMGKSDLHMQGRLENFVNYLLKDEMLKGNLQITSQYIDCNELMSASSPQEKINEQNNTELSVIVLPGDIDFTMNVKIDKILYERLVLSNATGVVVLKNGELQINNLSMKFAEGTMNLTGKYKANDPSKAITGLNMNLKNIEIASIIKSFDMFDKMLPILQALSGKVSLNFNFATDLDSKMTPILTSLSAIGAFSGDSVKITESENLNKITSLVGLTQSKDISKTLRNIKVPFTIKDGKIQVPAFPVKLGNINMMVGGQQGLDLISDFQIDMAVPANDIANKANDIMKQIGLQGTSSNTINVGIAVEGTTSNPTFKLVSPKYMTNKGIGQQATDQVKDLIQDKTNELLESLTGGNKSASDSTSKDKRNEAINQLKNLLKRNE